MKKLLVMLLCIVTVIVPLFTLTAGAATDTITSFSVNPYGNEEESADTVKWYKSSDGKIYLFLPSDCDQGELKVFFTSSGTVTVGDKILENGEVTDAFASGREFTLSCLGTDYKINILKSENLPAVYMTTESGSLTYIHKNKENREPGTIKISENGTVSLDKELRQIKGRGNATWSYAKKPYNIKFDKKTSVLGMDKAKKWTLIANWVDRSLQRNCMAFDLAEASGIAFTSQYRSVDLYINNEYMGNYLICESVEVDSARVDIEDLDKANENANPDIADLEMLTRGGTGKNNTVQSSDYRNSRKWYNIPNEPEDITGGYLLEIEISSRYNNEPCGFVTRNGQAMVIKSPDPASKAEVNYIADYFQQAEDAMLSETGYNSLGKHYSDYFDMDSLARMYILEEFALESDSAITSQYFYKKAGDDKIYTGPVWDFDNSFWNGNYNPWGLDYSDESIQMSNQIQYGVNNKTYFHYLFRHEDFRDKVSEIWDELKDVYNVSYTNVVNERSQILAASAVMDEFRWNKNPECKTYEAKLNEYNSYAETISRKFTNRIGYCTREFSPDFAMLYYNVNGGSGYAINKYIALRGESVPVVGQYSAAMSGKYFLGWNTEKDGTGITYKEGQMITLSERTTILYAVWGDTENPTEPETPTIPDDTTQPENPEEACGHICHSHNSFLNFFWKIQRFFLKLFGVQKTCKCGVNHY